MNNCMRGSLIQNDMALWCTITVELGGIPTTANRNEKTKYRDKRRSELETKLEECEELEEYSFKILTKENIYNKCSIKYDENKKASIKYEKGTI